MGGEKPTAWLNSNAARYAGRGIELAAGVLGGCLIGWWVDQQLASSPTGLLIGAGIGIVGGLYNLVRDVLRQTLNADRKGPKQPGRSDDSK